MATVELTELIEINVEKQITEENGKIKFPLDLFTAGSEMETSEFLGAIQGAKSEIKVESEGDEKLEQPKLQTLAKGFMFQAGKAMAGDEPFYAEVHLIGENQFAISANKNGVLTRNDMKAFRKALKSLMNQEKEEYNPEKQPNDIQYDDSMNDSYYEDGEIY